MADLSSIFSGALGGAGGGALTGASLGSLGGPGGTLVGAGIGAGVGGLVGGYAGYAQGKANEAQSKAYADARKRLAEMQRALYSQRMQNLNQAMGYFEPYLNNVQQLTGSRPTVPKFSTDLPAGAAPTKQWF
jgi:hypothetical protein